MTEMFETVYAGAVLACIYLLSTPYGTPRCPSPKLSSEQHKLAIQAYDEDLRRYVDLVAKAQEAAKQRLVGKKMEQSCTKIVPLYHQAAGKGTGILTEFISFMKKAAHDTMAEPFDETHVGHHRSPMRICANWATLEFLMRAFLVN